MLVRHGLRLREREREVARARQLARLAGHACADTPLVLSRAAPGAARRRPRGVRDGGECGRRQAAAVRCQVRDVIRSVPAMQTIV